MSANLPTILAAAVPVAFVSVDALLLVAAGLAATGAVLTGVILVRSRRRRVPPGIPAARRAPSPSSLGMAEDPIVAALVGGEKERERTTRAGPTDSNR